MSGKVWNLLYFAALLWQHCYADDNEKLGLTCPELESCEYLKNARINDFLLNTERTCACDSACGMYGDCCKDAFTIKRNEQAVECYEVSDYGGIFMINSCPSSFKGDDHLRNLCENSSIADPSDPIGTIPVTEFVSGITYKNIYCKLCSGISDAIDIWNLRLECPLLPLFNDSNSITDEFVLKNLILENGSWGLNIKLEDGTKFFVDCYINPVPPKELLHKIRPCKKNLVSDCPSFWKNTQIRSKCRSFLGPRFTQEGEGYRNVYCAVCNGENVSDLSCHSQQFDDFDIFRFSAKHSFAILMDINENTGDKVGFIQMCHLGEVYDPFFKKCRTLECFPGFVRRGLTCVPRKFTRKVYRKPISKKKSLLTSRKPVVSSTSSVNPELVDKNKTDIMNNKKSNATPSSFSDIIISLSLSMYKPEFPGTKESNIFEQVEIITKPNVIPSTSVDTFSTDTSIETSESYTTESNVQNVTLPSNI